MMAYTSSRDSSTVSAAVLSVIRSGVCDPMMAMGAAG